MTKKRIASIDILRGMVMLLMLLDHVRERFYYHHSISDPMSLTETSPELFFTRFITHFCAPIFIFLAGLSAWLYAHSSEQRRPVSGFLFKRGIFIIFIECTLVNFSWFGSYDALYLQVMWAIGISMIVLSLMVKTNYWLIGVTGLLIVFGHNALAPISFSAGENGYTLWTILHDRGYLIDNGMIKVKASYPVLPWIGVILLGYFSGPLYARAMSSLRRQKVLLLIGLSAWGLLLVLRGFNVYGETLDWQSSHYVIESVMSFVNFTKYPPSLDFLLLTLGGGCLLLAGLENVSTKWSHIMATFGSVPMFFYIVHLYILLMSYRLLLNFFGPNHGEVLGLNAMWQVWLAAVVLSVLLYFPTKAFSNYKKHGSRGWTQYF